MNITPSPLKHYKTLQEYFDFAQRLESFEDEIEKVKLNRLLCRTDLFWLIWFGCKRNDIAKQWLLDRCKEVEAAPNNHLDLWSRNHYKSTIITFGKSLQDILASHGDDPLPEWDREVTIGIFSATRPLAKGFLRQIKQELEKTEEKMVTRSSLEKSIPLITLMERVIDRSTLEDYNDIFNGAETFQDIFLRDFRAEYAENKSIVVDKGGKTGYYMNNAPCLWMFYIDDKMANPIKRLFTLIPLYHKYLKDFAKENGCNIKHFDLTLDMIAELEAVLLDEISYLISM